MAPVDVAAAETNVAAKIQEGTETAAEEDQAGTLTGEGRTEGRMTAAAKKKERLAGITIAAANKRKENTNTRDVMSPEWYRLLGRNIRGFLAETI